MSRNLLGNCSDFAINQDNEILKPTHQLNPDGRECKGVLFANDLGPIATPVISATTFPHMLDVLITSCNDRTRGTRFCAGRLKHEGRGEAYSGNER